MSFNKKLLIILLLVAIILILYFIFKPKNNNSIKKGCNIDEILVNNKCQKCPIVQQCGNQCIQNLDTQVCTSDTQICDIINYNPDTKLCCPKNQKIHTKYSDDGKTKKIIGYECCDTDYWAEKMSKCCDTESCKGYCCEGKHCDYTVKDGSNPCTDCPTDLCGKNCCKKENNEICFKNEDGIYSICCDPKFWDPDTFICCTPDKLNCVPGGKKSGNCPNNKIKCGVEENNCCDPELCINKSCCNSQIKCVDKNNIPTCYNIDFCTAYKDKDGNDHCLCCPQGEIFNKDNNQCGQLCGNYICDLDTSYCAKSGGDSITQYCQTIGCQWGTLDYIPPDINGTKIYSLSDTNDNKINKFYSVYDPKTLSSIDRNKLNKTSQTQETSQGKCTSNDCQGRVYEKGVKTTYMNNDHLCTSIFDPTLGISILQNPLCPLTDDNKTSCCFQKNNNTDEYTGQLCLNNQFCYNGPNIPNIINTGDCICNNKDITNCKIFDSSTCNNSGHRDLNSGLCICDSGYSGDKCECNNENTCNNNGDILSCNKCNCYPIKCISGTCLLTTNIVGFGNGSINDDNGGFTGNKCDIPLGFTKFVIKPDDRGHIADLEFTSISVNDVTIDFNIIGSSIPCIDTICYTTWMSYVYIVLMPGVFLLSKSFKLSSQNPDEAKVLTNIYDDTKNDYLDENHYILDSNIAYYNNNDSNGKHTPVPIRSALYSINVEGKQNLTKNLNLILSSKNTSGLFGTNVYLNINENIVSISNNSYYFFPPSRTKQTYTNYKIQTNGYNILVILGI